MKEFLRPVWAEINLAHAAHNITKFKQYIGPNCQLMAVVKANAYGHGDLEIAHTALANGASWLAVALPEEGLKLRRAGIAVPILVLGAVDNYQLELCVAKDLVVTVFRLETAQKLSNIARRLHKTAKVHVKIDTGMGRIGVEPEESLDFIKRLRGLPGIEVQGIYTHFAIADKAGDPYTEWQWHRFSWVLLELQNANINIPIKHCANTAATLLLPETHLDMVRVGLGIYGLYPCAHSIHLKPVFSLHGEAVEVKRVPRGTAISYGKSFVTWKDTTIVTVPLGYADGLSRRLGENGMVLINGKKFPFAGRITMDQVMIDAGDQAVAIGDQITFIGFQGDASITIDDWAACLDTINYEIPCMISDRVQRIYRN